MTQDQPAQPSMYCRRCCYALHGLSENRCPECGTAFDPTDPETFALPPDRQQRIAAIAGRSVAWAGAAQFVAPLALAYFTDSLNTDILGLIFWLLGGAVRQSSRKAAKWAIGLGGLMAIAGTASTVNSVLQGQAGTVAAWLVPSRGHTPLIVPLALAAWWYVNVVLLVRFLRETKEKALPSAPLGRLRP